MNRRIFLKSIAAACGAAVVCPGKLLKDEPKPVRVSRKHEFRWFAVKNNDAPSWCSSLNYDKYHHYEYTCTLCGFTKYVEFRSNPAQKMWMQGKDESYIEGEIYSFKPALYLSGDRCWHYHRST